MVNAELILDLIITVLLLALIVVSSKGADGREVKEDKITDNSKGTFVWVEYDKEVLTKDLWDIKNFLAELDKTKNIYFEYEKRQCIYPECDEFIMEIALKEDATERYEEDQERILKIINVINTLL